MIKFNELKGLKKALGLSKCNMRYHNKHVNGSGNFGRNIYPTDEMTGGKWSIHKNWFDITGDYDKDGNIYDLDVTFKSGGFHPVPLGMIDTFPKLVVYMEMFIYSRMNPESTKEELLPMLERIENM